MITPMATTRKSGALSEPDTPRSVSDADSAAKSGPEVLPPAAELIDQHGERLWLLATALVGDTHRAEDIVQEALITALRKRERFRPHADVGRWLRGILKRIALNERRQYGPLHVDLDLATRIDGVLERWRVSKREDRRPELTALEECIERLDDAGREVLAKRYDENCSCQDISTAFGKSVSWVKVTLHRLRATLRVCIEGKLSNEQR